MKLNLLPTYVSTGKRTTAAFVVFALIIVGSVLATVGMIQTSSKEVATAKDEAKNLEPYAKRAVEVSGYADTVISNAKGVMVDSMLADAMLKHNSVYPDFYDSVKPYIPSFFRITSMSAAPVDDSTATLTMTGVVETQEQYRDLMLALNRIPKVMTVARTGYDIVEQYVPPLVADDQTGRPIPRGDSHIPDDPLARLTYMIGKGQTGTSGFIGRGGFGSGASGAKGTMPNWSAITVTVVLPRNLQAPNPRLTLQGVVTGGGGDSTTTASSSLPGGSGPPAGTGAPGGPGAGPGGSAKAGAGGPGAGKAGAGASSGD